VASNAEALASIMALPLDDAARVLANAGANMCTGSWVLPTFDDPASAFRERQHALLAVGDNLATATTQRG